MNSQPSIYAEGLYWQMKKTNQFDLHPQSIKIDGDVALIHFYDNWIIENDRGEISQVEFKKFLVFR